MTDKQLICLLIDSAKCIAKLLKASNKAAFDYVIESTYSYGCLHGISCEKSCLKPVGYLLDLPAEYRALLERCESV